MEQTFGVDNEILFIVVLGICLALAIAVITLFVSLGRMRRRYAQMMAGSQEGNLETVLIELQDNLTRLSGKSEQQEAQMADIQQTLKKMKARLGIVRYNAFSQHGSDLSFSIAILDDEQDGIVLTGIHSREETYIYAKPVEKGNSTYSLSPEERKVIDQTAARRPAVSQIPRSVSN